MKQHAVPEKPGRFLRRHTVETLTGLSRSTLYHLMSTGEFPRPVKLSVRAVGWRESDIVAWIEARETTNA